MCDLTKTIIHLLALVGSGLTFGLTITQASAEGVMGWSGCTGQPIQIGTAAEPEKATVGVICLSKDVDMTGSTVVKAQDGKWTIAPVGQVTGNPEQDTVGYVTK